MGISQLAQDEVQLALLSANGHAGLAREFLTARFGLDPDHAESVLDQGYGLLVPRIRRDHAAAALPLLATLGLQVALQPCEALPPDEFCDISVRLADAKAARRAIATIERLTGRGDLAQADFGGASGLVLRGLSLTRGDWLCHALRRLPGVSASISETGTARYDLFAMGDLTETEALALRGQLRLMGCTLGGFSDALACGLDKFVLDRILARFPGLGLFGVNQAFQRHDVLIIGKGSLSQQDFVDFLLTRPVAQQSPVKQLLRSLPLKVESNLSRAAAGQFLADYSSIGMQAIACLVRRAETLWEKP